MSIQLAVQITLLLRFIHEVSAGVSSVALPGCPEKCGDVSIPYPFGIGPNCSLDGRIEINCIRNFNQSKPFLLYSNLEVRNISVQKRTIDVMNPVYIDCTDDREIKTVVAFEKGSFTFSATQNLFIAMGCNNLAVIESENESAIGGCLSFCDEKRKDEQSCFGINCCQTLIPQSFRNFRTSLTTFNGSREELCKYAFIVEMNWFRNLPNIYSVQKTKQVPVVLDWNLRLTANCYSLESTNISRFPSRNGSVCGRNTYCRNQICFCIYGYEGNPYLLDGCQDECVNNNTAGSYRCATAKLRADKVHKAPVILAIVATCGGLGVLSVLAATWWLCKVTKRRKKHKLKRKNFEKNGGLLLGQQVSSSGGNVDTTKLFTSKELEIATDHYNKDRILGQGGQGTVYKGMLADGRIVAVKKSKIEDDSKKEQFINEVVLLSKINHRNIVKLHGCCLETEIPLLVYEFIPNGTLFEYIHDHNEDFPLTWDIRVRVAREIAGALFYLHSAASFPIFHRDIKSSNILLDEKYRAKMADFGTSKSIAIDQTHMTTRVQGTFGYLDPEYFQSSQFTDKSDVYSFGIVLVELLTGQKAILTSGVHDEGRSLATHFILTMEENRIFDILDPLIAKEGRKEEITTFANIAYRCLNLNGRKRPTMKQVAAELESINMSRTLPTEEQPYEEVEYPVPDHLNGLWDLTSTSMSSSTSKSVKVDEEPLIRKN